MCHPALTFHSRSPLKRTHSCADVFLTGCEDGVVRQLDVREQPLVIDSSALRDAYCAESVVGVCL
eukprot:1156504-Pelagomonas_calceolata.AAC.3